MSNKRIFVDVEEVWQHLVVTAADDELFIPVSALRLAIAKSTQLIVNNNETEN